MGEIGTRERDLCESVLDRHRRNAEHACDDRYYCIGVTPRTHSNAKQEIGNEQKQL
jgi:hypothetical protein